MKKDFQKLELKEQERIREIIGQKLDTAITEIEEITGYYTELEWSIYADSLRKSVNIDIPIALLAKPHSYEEGKVKHFLKVNPDNCLDEPVRVFKYGSWYEIYNGVHRAEANRRKGKKTIKANIILADKETLERRDL